MATRHGCCTEAEICAALTGRLEVVAGAEGFGWQVRKPLRLIEDTEIWAATQCVAKGRDCAGERVESEVQPRETKQVQLCWQSA